MLKRLRIKFVCINMVIVTVILIAVFGVVLCSTQNNLENNSMHMLLMVSGEKAMRPGMPIDAPNEVRLPFLKIETGLHGKLIATGSNHYDLSDTAALQSLYNQVMQLDKKVGVLKEYNLRYLRTATPLGTTIAFVDISNEQETLHALLRTSLTIGTAAFLAFFVISILLARWAVKPVDEAWKQQKQFVADASHELKTPLTVILTNAELLQNPAYDEAYQEQFANSILTMAHQMRGLVESLLELARVDNSIVKKSFTELDFSRLISDAVLPFEPLFYEKGMTLQTRIDPSVRLKGSDSHLRQVVDILLDNAMKYASPNAMVVVGLRQQNHHCLLAIGNAGPPIAPEDLKNIFKRFYRVDPARSMNHSYGLGLSIAQGIVQDHRGKIWATSDRGFNTFYIQLPTI